MREIDGVGDAEVTRRQGQDRPLAIPDGQGPLHRHRPAGGALRRRPDPSDRLDERRRAAVENGNLRTIDLDAGVVDPQALERGEQVLHGGDGGAVTAERGGEARVPDRLGRRGNDLSAEIAPDEEQAVVGGSRENLHAGLRTGVQTNPFDSHSPTHRSLLIHSWIP